MGSNEDNNHSNQDKFVDINSNMDSIPSSPTSSASEMPTGDGTDFQLSYKRRYLTVAILFIVNLLNYADRSTIAGVLGDVQDYYDIGDGKAGLLQSIFVVGFMLTSPIFGYCGDRYNRKWIMIGGVSVWSGVTLLSSFIPQNLFWLFTLLRGVVGVGEASYVTVAPTMISDMFVDERRSSMLMVFYFAIPVGSGLGYIVGSSVAQALNGWQWAMRVTPGFGILCCLLLGLIAKDPPRGMAESSVSQRSQSSFIQDIVKLAKNKTFVLSTSGNVCVTFIAGALAFFAPKFLQDAYRVQGVTKDQLPDASVSLYAGIVAVVTGFAGVALGTEVAKRVKRRYKDGDPLVCGAGLLLSTPFMFAALVVCEFNMIAAWFMVSLGEILIFLNWPLVADMLLYTVPATMRSTATAIQIFVVHALGDASSPYILGFVSDTVRGDSELVYDSFKSLQSALYINLFIGIVGGGCFLMASLFIIKDWKKAEAETKGIPLSKLLESAKSGTDIKLEDVAEHSTTTTQTNA